MDLLVAHDVGFPEIVGADNDAVALELFALFSALLRSELFHGGT